MVPTKSRPELPIDGASITADAGSAAIVVVVVVIVAIVLASAAVDQPSSWSSSWTSCRL